MGEYVPGIELPAQVAERRDLVFFERAGSPLVAALYEELDGVAPDREPPLEREVHAPRDRHVRTEIHSAFHLMDALLPAIRTIIFPRARRNLLTCARHAGTVL